MILQASRKAILGAMMFMAKRDPRYYLCGICFGPDKKLISTDGHRMFIGEHQTEEINENIIIKITGPRFIAFDHLTIDTESGVVTYLDESDKKVGLALAEVIEGKFPDWKRVVPKSNYPVTQIGFNAGYLSDVEKLAKLYNPKWSSIAIKPNGQDGAAQIDVYSPGGSKASVIVMPMRL